VRACTTVGGLVVLVRRGIGTVKTKTRRWKYGINVTIVGKDICKCYQINSRDLDSAPHCVVVYFDDEIIEVNVRNSL